MVKNKQYHTKVLLNSFHLHGHDLGLIHILKSYNHIYLTQGFNSGSERVAIVRRGLYFLARNNDNKNVLLNS